MKVHGQKVDQQTRCIHYHSEYDVIAIKFKCCQKYYPCYQCHQEAGHPIQKWPKDEFNQKAILCGVCEYELTINEYLNGSNQCPNCHAKFNPGCANHYHIYFE